MAFERGDFADAAEKYQTAYDRARRPQLLYNIGIAHDRAGHLEEALNRYQLYLAELPDATNAKFVRSRVTVLSEMLDQRVRTKEQLKVERAAAERAKAEQKVLARKATELERARLIEEAKSDRQLQRVLSISLVGLGVIAGGVAIVAGVQAGSKRSELEGLCSPQGGCPESARSTKNELGSLAIMTDIFLGVGLAAIIAGGLWLFTTFGKLKVPTIAPSATFVNGGLTVGLASQF